MSWTWCLLGNPKEKDSVCGWTQNRPATYLNSHLNFCELGISCLRIRCRLIMFDGLVTNIGGVFIKNSRGRHGVLKIP